VKVKGMKVSFNYHALLFCMVISQVRFSVLVQRWAPSGAFHWTRHASKGMSNERHSNKLN